MAFCKFANKRFFDLDVEGIDLEILENTDRTKPAYCSTVQCYWLIYFGGERPTLEY